MRRQNNSGAALIIAIAVLTILLAIALTFFTVTRLELKTSTNVENSVRADALNVGAVNIAISFLRHDAWLHPTYTSIDHAWRTYFNGTCFVGKPWAFPNGGNYASGAIPEIYFTEEPDGFGGIIRAGGGGSGDLYFPRKNPVKGQGLPQDPTQPMRYATTAEYLANMAPQYMSTYGFVTQLEGAPNSDLTMPKLTVPEQVAQWADVDNDGDGLPDSVWIPMAADVDMGDVWETDSDSNGVVVYGSLLTPGDGADNDLDGVYNDAVGSVDFSKKSIRPLFLNNRWDWVNWVFDVATQTWVTQPIGDYTAENGIFLYYGGNDGLDNNGDDDIDNVTSGAWTPEDRWFLTSPINAADGTYVTLRNVQIPVDGVPTPVNINTDPRLPWPTSRNQYLDGQHRWVDALDNDYDLVRNDHTEYFTLDTAYEDQYKNDPDSAKYDDVIKALQKSFDARGMYWCKAISNKTHEFDVLVGLHEISPQYLDTTPTADGYWWRIKSSGEPVSDLVGRAAIYVTDEASKVNMNVAGGRNLDVPVILSREVTDAIPLEQYADDTSGIMTYLSGAHNKGATPGEYCTIMLPDTGDVSSAKYWNLLTGAPMNAPVGSDNYLLDVQNRYVPDVILPGYGFADDDANALVLATNGIDDNGNGLVDEGVNDGGFYSNNKICNLTPEQIASAVEYMDRVGWGDTGTRLIPNQCITDGLLPSEANEAMEVYKLFLGHFEGIDEPGELRQFRPYRDYWAEIDGNVKDANGNSNVPGIYGDHVLKTREEVKRARGTEGFTDDFGQFVPKNTGTFFDRLKNLITIHSNEDNKRHQFKLYDENGNMVDHYAPPASGLKLDLNFASATEIADAFRQDWLMEPYNVGVLEDPNDPNSKRYSKLERMPDTMVRSILYPSTVDDYIQSASFKLASYNAGLLQADTSLIGLPYGDMLVDPYLRMLKLGALIVDSRKKDLARSEVTMEFDDQWWFMHSVLDWLRYNRTNTFDEAKQKAEHKQIKYTVTGLGGIRITEMMVRPVRRVEAETFANSNAATAPNYDPYNFDLPGNDTGNRFDITEYNPANPFDTNAWQTVQLKFNFGAQELCLDKFKGALVPYYSIIGQYIPDPDPTQLLDKWMSFGFWPRPLPEGGAIPPLNPVQPYLGPGAVRNTKDPFFLLEDKTNPNPQTPILLKIPNVIQFEFKPSPALPPGRYYLTFNTTNWHGVPTVDDDTTNNKHMQIKVATKYYARNSAIVPAKLPLWKDVVEIPANPFLAGDPRKPKEVALNKSILDDVYDLFEATCVGSGSVNSNFAQDPLWLSYWSTYWRNPIIGRDGAGRLTGWVFAPGLSPGDVSAPVGNVFGYAQDQAFTVTVPPYADDPANQVSLLVAVCTEDEWPVGQELAINFFDFSQEPDHEWIEIENTSGKTIDFSQYNPECQLVVGGVDASGNVVTDDAAVLAIPRVLPNDPAKPVTLAPNARMLLAVNADDYFEPDEIGPPYNDPEPLEAQNNLLFHNGIGLLGGDYDVPVLGGVARNFKDVTFPDMVPRSEDTLATFSLDADGRGVPFDALVPTAPAPPFHPFETPALRDSVVQLSIVQAPKGLSYPIRTKDDIAAWVLRGGIFPNYPDHDGIDNSNCANEVESDGVDNNGNYDPSNTTLFDNGITIDEVDEGIDRGWYRKYSGRLSDVNGLLVVPAAFPGQWNTRPVRYTFLPYKGFDLLLDDVMLRDPMANGATSFADYDVYYGPDAQISFVRPFPPEWKEFSERRFFPGDSVIVTLFEGSKDAKKVIDRVTYTEQDVVNRSMNDMRDVLYHDSSGTPKYIRPPLAMAPEYPDPTNLIDWPYTRFWPENSMGVDFYRTLERKHSAYYDGDRFGTKNRWEATDGNYDDWSHDPVQITNPLNGNLSDFDGNRFFGTPLYPNAGYDPDPLFNPELYRSTIASLPLNQAVKNELLGKVDRLEYKYPLLLASVGMKPPDYLNILAPDPLNAINTLWNPFLTGKTLVAKNAYNSSVELADLPYANFTKGFSKKTDAAGNIIPEEFAVPEAMWLDMERADGLQGLVLKNFEDPPFMKALMEMTAFAPVRLGIGTADFFLLSPAQSGVSSSELEAMLNYDTTSGASIPWPSAWSPQILYPLESTPADDYPSVMELTNTGTYLYPWYYNNQWMLHEDHFLFNMPPFPGSINMNDVRSRWPYVRRANLLIAANPKDYKKDLEPRQGSSALLVWKADDGLENGEYELYIDTGRDVASIGMAVGAVSPMGLKIATENTQPGQRAFDVEAFTDRNNWGKCWVKSMDAPDVYENLIAADNDTTTPKIKSDSLGKKLGLVAGPDGYVHYGTVRIQNHFLGVFVKNRSDIGRLNRISGIILAPAARTPGRININTVETRLDKELNKNGGVYRTRLFNALMGLPGILTNPGQPFEVGNATPPILSQNGVVEFGNWDTVPTPELPAAADIRQDRLKRAHLIEVGRPVTSGYTNHPDGRYYTFVSDLFEGGGTSILPAGAHPLSMVAEVNHPAKNADGTYVNIAPKDAAGLPMGAVPVNEVQWRMDRLANLITTHSDTFEILVTVQTGYGIDMDNDGIINYRSRDPNYQEFVITAEKKTRTVYQR